MGGHRELDLEGTRFPLFTEKDAFFQECREPGQAALTTRFADYQDLLVSMVGAGGGVIRGSRLIRSTRLLCASCLMDMPGSFVIGLPGGPMGAFRGAKIVVGESPSNLGSSAEAAKCPYCGSAEAILLYDRPDYGDITEKDVEALRELWRFRCQLWWQQDERSEGLCNYCGSATIPRGEGYRRGPDLMCEKCAVSATDSEALAELAGKPHPFGVSELRRARNFQSGRWRFEQGSIVTTPG